MSQYQRTWRPEVDQRLAGFLASGKTASQIGTEGFLVGDYKGAGIPGAAPGNQNARKPAGPRIERQAKSVKKQEIVNARVRRAALAARDLPLFSWSLTRAYQRPAEPINVAIPTSMRVTFLCLEHDHCRWPGSDDTYCGAGKIKGSSYCAGHHKMAYRGKGKKS
jgi:hypothetical protein